MKVGVNLRLPDGSVDSLLHRFGVSRELHRRIRIVGSDLCQRLLVVVDLELRELEAVGSRDDDHAIRRPNLPLFRQFERRG